MARFPSPPRTPKEARARSLRKLKAIRNRTKASLYDIAGFFDEGQVSGSIDLLLTNIDTGVDDIIAMIDEDIERQSEAEAGY